jgi:hypothetical protein
MKAKLVAAKKRGKPNIIKKAKAKAKVKAKKLAKARPRKSNTPNIKI